MYNLKAQELFVPRTVEIYPMVLEKKNLQTFTDGRTKSYHAEQIQYKKTIAHFFCSGQQKNKKQKKTNKTKANKKQKII